MGFNPISTQKLFSEFSKALDLNHSLCKLTIGKKRKFGPTVELLSKLKRNKTSTSSDFVVRQELEDIRSAFRTNKEHIAMLEKLKNGESIEPPKEKQEQTVNEKKVSSELNRQKDTEETSVKASVAKQIDNYAKQIRRARKKLKDIAALEEQQTQVIKISWRSDFFRIFT